MSKIQTYIRMKQKLDFIINSNEALNKQTFLLKVSPKNGELLPDMHPGQFVHLLVHDSSSIFLRRPLSVNYFDKEKNEIWLLLLSIGGGTKRISEMEAGDSINLLFPLGKGFSMPSVNQKTLLIGGGVGTAPLLFLGKRLAENGHTPEFLLGGRSAIDITQLEDFEKLGIIYTTTEDGSLGEKGLITHHPVLNEKRFDKIYTCGPRPMMQAIAKHAVDNNIECEASLENHMPCGFGACLCCIENTKRGNICICTEGPVFNINELKWID